MYLSQDALLFSSYLVTFNLKGKAYASHDIIEHVQPDDFTAGTARREHVRFCSNISLKQSTNSFTGQEREEQYLQNILLEAGLPSH